MIAEAGFCSDVINFRLETAVITSCMLGRVGSEVVVCAACLLATTSMFGAARAVCVMKLTCAVASSSSSL